MTYYKFNNKFFKQKYDFPTGKSTQQNISQFLEFLESGSFKYRQHSNSTYLRYIDNILIFQPQNIKIEEIAEKLNNDEPSINFTYEKESNNTIQFLEILIIKSQNSLTFKVYRKPTNRNDYIHSYFHHHNKTGFKIGFLPKSTQKMWPTVP